MRRTAIAFVAFIACRGPQVLPPATADQTVRDAMLRVCDAPARAEVDIGHGVRKSDAIAGHLSDGIGNDRVLATVEAWKTKGIAVRELDALLDEAKLATCALRETADPR